MQQWRQISDSKQNGSGLAGRDDPECFIIVNPVLSDTNGGINAVYSGPLDTPLVNTNMDEFNSENEVGEHIEYNDASSDEQENESEHFCEKIRKRKNTCADKVAEDAKNKKEVVAKPHEKRSVARSQLQAMSQLAASVNRLTEVNARKMIIGKKDRKSSLEFRKEDVEKKRKHEKYMAELYLRMMNHSHSTNSNPFVYNQLSNSFISPSKFTATMSSSAASFSPFSQIGALSNRFQSSSTQPLDGKTYTFQFPQINNN